MKRILEFVNSSGLLHKQGLINFLIIRILNIIFPLLAYNHVLKVVGLSNFGFFAAANGIIIFLAIFTNYGFELSGPIEVSRFNNDGNKNLVNKVSSQIIFIRSVLTIIALILIIPLSIFVRFDITLILLAFHQIVFETLSLAFFFQGLNQLIYLVNITLISKFLSTSLCILFINKSNQIILFPIFLGLGNMVSLFYSYYIANKKYNFHFQKFSFEDLVDFLKKSTLIFSGNLFSKIYQNGPRLFFSIFLNPIYSACYDVADKLVNIITVPLAILTDSILRNAGGKLIPFQSKNRSLLILFSISSLLILSVFLGSEILIEILQTSDIKITKKILFLLALSVLFSSLSNYLKIFHFINIGKNKFVAIAVFFGAVFFLLTGLLLKYFDKYDYFNGVLIFALVEVFIFICFFLQYIIDYFSFKKL